MKGLLYNKHRQISMPSQIQIVLDQTLREPAQDQPICWRQCYIMKKKKHGSVI